MLLGYMKLKIKKYLLYTKLNLYLIIINSNNAPNPSVSSQVNRWVVFCSKPRYLYKMKVCTKCNTEKELDQYLKYFHSTQQKWRVRGECTDCYYKTRLKRTNPNLYYQNNPDYKKCRDCGEWKLLDNYYFHSRVTGARFTTCKVCQKESDRIQQDIDLENKGGSIKIKNKPNDYYDKYQKQQTFMVLEVLGYIYYEEKGIWLKPGVKELVDGKIVFPNHTKENKVGKYRAKVTSNLLKLMKEYREQGHSYNKIADMLDISDTTVFKYLNGKTD